MNGALVQARSIAHACELLAKGGQLIAGGTDLVVDTHLAPVTPNTPPPRTWIDVSSVGELARIEDRGATIRLGGGVTYLQLRRDAIAAKLPMLAAMAKDVGAIQIQARGTLAGNLATASPAADGVAALAALDATIGLASIRGERAVKIDDFFVGYRKTARAADEVIAWIDLPVSASAHWYWRKVGTRLAQAISKVALAGVAELDGKTITHARFGMASVAAATALLPAVRAALIGRSLDALDDATLDRAVETDVKPIDDVRSTGKYRLHVAKALIRAFVRSLR